MYMYNSFFVHHVQDVIIFKSSVVLQCFSNHLLKSPLDIAKYGQFQQQVELFLDLGALEQQGHRCGESGILGSVVENSSDSGGENS